MNKININQNVWSFVSKRNRSPPSQNILNIFLSQRHLIIARLNVRWLLTQIISLQRVDLLKKRQDLLTNQSVSGGHIYLLPTKSSVSAISVNLTIFLDDFFFVSVGNFAQFWKYQTIWYNFSTVFPIRILQDVMKNSTTICFFLISTADLTNFLAIFLTIFFSESGGNFALQSAPLLTEFSEYALLAVSHVNFKQTVLYDVSCGYLELFNYWYCLVFYDIFLYLTLISKVPIFWEGHTILRNIHLTFEYSTNRQN